MKKTKLLPSREHLLECLEICNESPSGAVWKNRPRHHFTSNKTWKGTNRRFAGKPAGNIAKDKDGYNKWSIMINLNTYTLSRCIYLIGKGEFNQEQEIDHIDCNSLNNHLDNLRLADCSDNCKNKKLSKVNTSGFKGVHWCKMRKAWISQINVNGKKIYLGKYSTPEGAHDSYIRASVEFHGDFGRVA